MTELSITYFPKLPALAQDAEVNFQYVRVGNWLKPDFIYRAMTQFPGKKFLYHHNGNIRVHECDLTPWREPCPRIRQGRLGQRFHSAFIRVHL
jgi:hypothetical protein